MFTQLIKVPADDPVATIDRQAVRLTFFSQLAEKNTAQRDSPEYERRAGEEEGNPRGEQRRTGSATAQELEGEACEWSKEDLENMEAVHAKPLREETNE